MLVLPNAVWRLRPGSEIHAFEYLLDGNFGPYKLNIPHRKYPSDGKHYIPFPAVWNMLLQNKDAIGAFNSNDISIVVVFPDHVTSIRVQTSFYLEIWDKRATMTWFDEPIAEPEEWDFIGFKRTPIISEEVCTTPIRLVRNGLELSDNYEGLYKAKIDPPISLYKEMLDHNADYVYVDYETDKPVFGHWQKEEYKLRGK